MNSKTEHGGITPAKYKCMPRHSIKDGIYSIATVRPHDIESIRLWRNSQMEILRQAKEITREEQENYYKNHIWPELDIPEPRNMLVSYFENNRHVGYGGLVHIAWEHRRAEVSFLLDTELTKSREDYERYFLNFLNLIKQLAFRDLGMERIFTETYAIRAHHIQVLESSGFRREGVLKHHVRINGQPVDSIIHGCLADYD